MSSRLIVKGLPKRCTAQQLQKMFAQRGTVTDCTLKYTKEGIFRRFAFVGFHTEKEAQDALEYFANTFIGTSRIQVEVCKPFGDESKPRAWSKYARDSSAYHKLHPDSGQEGKNAAQKPIGRKTTMKMDSETKSEPKFGEFLELHGKSLDNADVDSENDEGKDATEESLEGKLLENAPSNSADLAVIISGLPAKVKAKSLKDFLAPVRLKAMKFARNETEAASLVTFSRAPDLRRVLKRDGEFFGGFKLYIKESPTSRPDSKKTIAQERGNADPAVDAEAVRTSEAVTVDAIMDTGRLFVRNLAYQCTEEALTQLFNTFGQVSDLTMPVDRKSGKSKGFAMVTYLLPEQAAKAYSQLDGHIFQGRMMHILPGKEKPNEDKTDQMSGAFKEQKTLQQKKTATSEHNWNSLFLGANAVAETIAEKLKTEKGILLDKDSDASLGVRLALGETRLVRETRDFLQSHGVQLDSFGKADAARSTTVILVKNLPPKTSVEELKRMFGRYGELGRCVIPPEGGISCLIEFVHAQEARAAFSALAYARFRTVPLYLEWAPGEVFTSEAIALNEEKAKKRSDAEMETDVKMETEISDEKESLEKALNSSTSGDLPDTPEADSTLFVKNLSFETSDAKLSTKFGALGPLQYATVSKKKDPKNATKLLSMGFGFVQYKRKTDAQRAMKELQGVLLDGHCLELKLSTRDEQSTAHSSRRSHSDPTATTAGSTSSSKLLVRNVPFEASRKELLELFSAFGTIRQLRLPLKVASNDDGDSGRHRGFAFVDFLTHNEAQRAFDALCHSTHLYGRRLVLEWADGDEETMATVDRLRQTTARRYTPGGVDGGKRKRKLKDTLEGGNADDIDD